MTLTPAITMLRPSKESIPYLKCEILDDLLEVR